MMHNRITTPADELLRHVSHMKVDLYRSDEGTNVAGFELNGCFGDIETLQDGGEPAAQADLSPLRELLARFMGGE